MRELGIASLALMENAGAGAARIARHMLGTSLGRVICLCGPGGNGGDALVVARHLAISGTGVEIVLVCDEPRGDAAIQLATCLAMRLPVHRRSAGLDAFAPGDSLIVDGIYGTGLTRAVQAGPACAIDAANRSGLPILALDVPTGLDCDSGEPLGACIRATVTATFAAMKLGFANPRSREYTGEVRLVGIGAPVTGEPASDRTG